MTDRWFNRAAPPDHGAQRARDAASQAGMVDLHPVWLSAPVTTVDDRDFSFDIAEDRRLLQRFFQRMAIVRIARHRAGTHHQPFPVCRRDRHLDAKLVWR